MENKPKRTLVIGDVHGAAKALKQVLERSNWNPELDKIIQLGDVADGWSETSECVDILLDIKKQSVHKPVFIRGNHDVWVYDWMMFGLTPYTWTTQGGKATMESYVKTGKLVDKEHKNFWFTQLDWYIDEENRIFIHAGWDYRIDPNAARHSGDYLSDMEVFIKQASAKLGVGAGTIAKECHWDRSLIKNAAAVSTFKAKGIEDYNKKVQKALNLFKEIYVGHTVSREHKVENFENLWNMDSGGGWKGRLSIMDIDTKEIWYADKSPELYPNELGRG